MRSIFLILVMAASCFSAYEINRASGRFRDSIKVDSLRNSVGIGTDAAGKFIKSDSVRACSIADSAKVAGLIVHGVTPGTVPKAATDSTFENSHISENGDTTKIICRDEGSNPTYNRYQLPDNDSGWNDPTTIYENGLFVTVTAARFAGGKSIIATSSDGCTYTIRYEKRGSVLEKSTICYGNSIYMALVSNNGTTAVRSTDGVNFSEVTIPSVAGGWYYISFANGLFYLSAGFYGCRTSADGINWSDINNDIVEQSIIEYGNGVYVAHKVMYGEIWVSTDLATWDLVEEFQYQVGGVKFINNKFIAAGYLGVSTSTDGLSWTSPLFPDDSTLFSDISYGNGYCLVSGFSFGSHHNNILYSNDFEEWDTLTTGVYGGFWGSAFGSETFSFIKYNYGATEPDSVFVSPVWGGVAYIGGKLAIANTPTTTTPAFLLAKNAAPDNEIKKIPISVLDPPAHNVTPGQIPMSNGATTFRNTGTTVDSTTGDIHVYGKIIVGDTAYTSVPGMVEGHGNQSDVDKDSLMVSLAAAPAGDKRRGGAFRAFGNEASPANGNVVMESGDSGDALIGGKEIYIHVDHPSDTSALGVPVFKNDVRIGRDDVLPDDIDRVAIYLGRSADSSCGRIYGGKGASSTKATMELGNNANNKITISADTVRIIDRLETILTTATLGVIDTFDVGLMRVGGGSNIIDIHRRTDTLVIKLSATDSLCFKAVAP